MADTKEFDILVENSSVADSITHHDFHNCRSKSGGVSLGDGLRSAKSTHAATSNEVNTGAFETRVGTSLVSAK